MHAIKQYISILRIYSSKNETKMNFCSASCKGIQNKNTSDKVNSHEMHWLLRLRFSCFVVTLYENTMQEENLLLTGPQIVL